MKRSLAILVASSFALAAVGANAAQHDQDQSGVMADGGGQPGGMMGQGGMMGRGGMSHAMMLKMMVALADTNNDGALSLEEVQAVHARMFNMADGDGNGQITMEEIQGFMQGDATAAPQAR
ncbi:hypothetical protein [uncultured Paracoccus sp.]|uniref:hypothetical protein n=1 Tax=uncultured Paracoccus sp. TaxID=189685 RepID=UPI00260D9023|nr:hypothetical protein [uncultured Paracoccus sp.]